MGQYIGKEYILALRWFEMDTDSDRQEVDADPDPNRQALDADTDPYRQPVDAYPDPQHCIYHIHQVNLDVFWHYFRECDVRHETELSLFKLTDYLAYKGGSGTEATQW